MHVFLSYPKSGRTWLRFMIDSYLCRLHDASPDNVFAIEKQLAGGANHVEWTHLTGAMILRKPYWAMSPIDLTPVKNVPWLMLVRAFVPTLRSAYFQARDRIQVFNGTPSEFVRDPRYGIAKLVTFYNLWTHEWRDQLNAPHVFAYENVLADPTTQLTQMVEALHLPVHENWIADIVAQSTKPRMAELGLTPAYANTPLAPADPNRPETYKVRDGAGNDDLFNADDLAYIHAVVNAMLLAKDDPMFQAISVTSD